MRLLIPADQIRLLTAALKRAKTSEIGGQIYGEQIEASNFKALELTFQRRPGTFARFVVDLIQAATDAALFFRRTGNQFRRYNYIGEWHSHPSFEVNPSSVDIGSMRDLVTAPDYRGNFAVLMIVRLDGNQLACGAWLFDTNGETHAVTLEIEQ